MITVNGDWFALETANTGYYLGVRGGLVENLHYGARVRVENSVPLREKTDIGYGGDVVYRAESAPLSLEHLCLELSPLQKGDYRAQSLSLVMPGGARTADFSFVCARRLEGSVPPEGMPAAPGRSRDAGAGLFHAGGAWLSRCFIPCTRTATSSRGAFV